MRTREAVLGSGLERKKHWGRLFRNAGDGVKREGDPARAASSGGGAIEVDNGRNAGVAGQTVELLRSLGVQVAHASKSVGWTVVRLRQGATAPRQEARAAGQSTFLGAAQNRACVIYRFGDQRKGNDGSHGTKRVTCGGSIDHKRVWPYVEYI